MTEASAGRPAIEVRFPIVQYWHEENPPNHVAELLASFREHNPSCEHLVFNESTAEDLIATHYGPRLVAAFRACALPAMQADFFRYCAVHALGGLYADADLRCLTSLASLVEGPASGVLFGRPGPLAQALAEAFSWPYPVGSFRTLVNGVFAFEESGHPLLELAIELATANVENRLGEGALGVWLAAGPGIFTALYLLRELGSVDALAEYAAESVLAPAVPSLRQIAGDQKAVRRAFDRVEIRPLDSGRVLMEETPRLPAPRQQRHWVTSNRDIYR